MLCVLGQGRLVNFFFRANAFKPYSTVKYMGLIDNNNAIKNSNVFYDAIDLDNPDYDLPDTAFDMRGTTRLGFRQLPIERWAAAPLYTLSIVDEKVREKLFNEGGVLSVRLQNKRSQRRAGIGADGSEHFVIAGVESTTGSISPRAIKLQLNTLSDVDFGDSSYWLDSGSVIR